MVKKIDFYFAHSYWSRYLVEPRNLYFYKISHQMNHPRRQSFAQGTLRNMSLKIWGEDGLISSEIKAALLRLYRACKSHGALSHGHARAVTPVLLEQMPGEVTVAPAQWNALRVHWTLFFLLSLPQCRRYVGRARGQVGFPLELLKGIR